MWQIWFIIVIILLISNLCYPSLLITCFSIASLLTFSFSFFLDNLLLNIIIFLFFTTLIRLFFPKYLLSFIKLPQPNYNNTDYLINQTGTITKSIGIYPFHTGLVHINHETWIASSSLPIAEGTSVKVTHIQGLIVSVVPIYTPH